MNTQVKVVDLLVAATSEKQVQNIDSCVQTLGAAAVVEGSFDGKSCRVRCFGNHGFIKFAFERQGYGKILGEESVNETLSQSAPFDATSKAMQLSKGNPGALRVLRVLVELSSVNAAHEYFEILESSGVEGSRIWILYKDMCLEEFDVFLGLLKSVKRGFFSKNQLFAASNEEVRDDIGVLRATMLAVILGG